MVPPVKTLLKYSEGGGEGGTPTALESDDQFCLILTIASTNVDGTLSLKRVHRRNFNHPGVSDFIWREIFH